MTHMSQLLQGFDIGVLKSLGGRVGGSHAQALHASYTADDSNLPLAFMRGKPIKGSVHHTGKSHTVGGHRSQLNLLVKVRVLLANA